MNKLIVPEYLEKKDGDTDKPSNVHQLYPVTGGKDPTDDWLSRLKKDTVFLCAPRVKLPQKNLFCHEYHVIWQTEGETRLLDNMNEDKYFWVINKTFSEAFELVRILVEPQEEEQEP